MAAGSGEGCSLSQKERDRPLPERPVLAVERRVFCLRCAWSAPAAARVDGELVDHLAEHRGAESPLGQDWALGTRYGPSGGTRPRGKACPLPALRRRSGAGVETAERKARRIAAAVATRRRTARERAAAGNATAGAAVE